jgi:GDP-4-dehydro-6-deoxy-D-mannose reductase
MQALVTGADGFVGQWLVRALLAQGMKVCGTIRGDAPLLTTLGQDLAAQVRWERVELADSTAIGDLVRRAVPSVVFHLAAQSSVPQSQRKPLQTLETNVMGTVRLLEAVRMHAPVATVLVVGSSDAYGIVGERELPLGEDAPLRPTNPYAASKAAAEIIALQYARSERVRTIATRSFNHTGPGQSPAFAIASFAKQIAAVKDKRQTATIRTGDLSPRRDLCDVRDVAGAYLRLASDGNVGEVYNVCSGRDVSMREVVDELARLAGVRVEARQDPELVRPVDNPMLRGDPSRIFAQTGWQAATPLSTTLADLLEFYGRAAA